ncbi:hypothetical protein [Sphaerobacter sp.]|uniref:hypothetical protein n=1 Tax=Sphaerobacter sp. TaxID=2099654 RepID=UPI001E067F61|nr:hypothetical protein [Sphaerobacter sp.]MBX5445010.1 hypothetical protein [Sphaerobacter sp.]
MSTMDGSGWLIADAVIVGIFLLLIGMVWLACARRAGGRLPPGADLVPGALIGLLLLVFALLMLWSMPAMG